MVRNLLKAKKAVVVILVVGMLFGLAGCSSQSGNDEPDVESNVENERENERENEITDLEKVTVVLDYLPNTNHTGIYAAKELGYYEALGLDVEIIEPADNTVTTLIATGNGDFGVSYQEDITYALTAEDPLPIKAIAAIIQHNTSGFVSFADKNIQSPADFEGKVYSGWGSPSEEAIIRATMVAAGADPDSLSMITSGGSGYASLKDAVDIMWIFWAWDGIAMKRDKIPVNYVELRELDDRLDYYTPVIIASNDTIENRPELAEKFMEATTKGYEFSIKNPVEAATILHKYADTYDLEMLIESQEYLAEKYSEGTETWGLMKDEVWDRYTEFMVESELIKEAIPASECYTNEFLR